jgi:hypothetical protein
MGLDEKKFCRSGREWRRTGFRVVNPIHMETRLDNDRQSHSNPLQMSCFGL